MPKQLDRYEVHPRETTSKWGRDYSRFFKGEVGTESLIQFLEIVLGQQTLNLLLCFFVEVQLGPVYSRVKDGLEVSRGRKIKPYVVLPREWWQNYRW
jgi:hypothetical protein